MRKTHVVVIFPYELWTKKMSFVRRDQVAALRSMSSLKVTVTGPGFGDWNNDLTLRDNLNKHPVEYDAIWWYKPDACKEPEHHPCPATVAYNEAWWDDWKAFRECKATAVENIVCHHMNDLERFAPPEDIVGKYRAKAFHISHCADCAFFAKFSKPWAERDIDVLVTGTLSPEFYPLRARVATMVRDQQLPGIIRNHPGTRLMNLDMCDAQREEYARMLGRTKVAIVCSSIYNYGLAKYAETAAAGCCVCGDIPPDYADTLAQGMLEIKPEWGDGTIKHTILNALDTDKDTHERARACQKLARKWHSMKHYAENASSILRGLV